VVIHKEVVNGEEIEYWRKLTVYATSYSPCRVGGGRCDSGTASGSQVGHGTIATTVDWFLAMRGQGIYVPGYGTGYVADTGGGIPGRYWIDLGYSDADYISWHQWVTIYFLTPVPEYVPPVLYP
jgi:3D (Asp-Asp-Asp) domain-containing protein